MESAKYSVRRVTTCTYTHRKEKPSINVDYLRPTIVDVMCMRPYLVVFVPFVTCLDAVEVLRPARAIFVQPGVAFVGQIHFSSGKGFFIFIKTFFAVTKSLFKASNILLRKKARYHG